MHWWFKIITLQSHLIFLVAPNIFYWIFSLKGLLRGFFTEIQLVPKSNCIYINSHFSCCTTCQSFTTVVTDEKPLVYLHSKHRATNLSSLTACMPFIYCVSRGAIYLEPLSTAINIYITKVSGFLSQIASIQAIRFSGETHCLLRRSMESIDVSFCLGLGLLCKFVKENTQEKYQYYNRVSHCNIKLIHTSLKLHYYQLIKYIWYYYYYYSFIA